jgi:hypothetical protein
MNDETTNLDQTDEDILTYTVFRRGAGGCGGVPPCTISDSVHLS